MNDIAKKLIKVFSKKAAADITHDDIVVAFVAADYKEVEEMFGFEETFNRIDRAKRILDYIAQKYPQAENQALHCLSVLDAKLTTKRGGRYREPPAGFWETELLIRESLYTNWGDIQGEYDTRCKVLGEWNDVFISYTNRDALATNQCYSNLVLKQLGRDVDPAATQSNCIASIIAKHLRFHNLSSFYDSSNLRCGDDIEDKIRVHTSSAIAFVQLLEPQIFEEPAPPKKNWCNEEFVEFSQSRLPCVEEAEPHNRHFFILARGDELNHILPANQEPYTDWIEVASRKVHLKLNKYSDNLDGLRIAVGGIAADITAARKKIITAMLEAW